MPAVIERNYSIPLDTKKIITWVGARRSGKTYLLYQIINQVELHTPREKITLINCKDERLDNDQAITDQCFSMEASDLELSHQYLTGMEQQSASECIAFLLLELFQRSCKQDVNNYDTATNSVAFPLTQKDIGDAVGLTSIHVNRIINDFKKRKLIDCQVKRLWMLNSEKRYALADFA